MEKIVKKDARPGFYDLVILFVLISFLGWCMEMIYFRVRWKSVLDRGFLTLPLCTIYGSCILAVYLIIGTPQGGRLQPLFMRAKQLRILPRGLAYTGLYVIYFLVVSLIPTVAEFIVGLFFDKVFDVVLWDYSYYTFDILGYVCLEMTLVWGIVITMAMRFVWPLLVKLVCLSSPRVVKVKAIVLSVLIFADLVFNFIYLCINGCHFVLF